MHTTKSRNKTGQGYGRLINEQQRFIKMAELNHLFSCPLCELSFLSVRAYVSHVRLIHFRENNITLMCGINGCVTSFGSFAGFNSHVYRHHQDALELTGVQCLLDLSF